MNHSLVIIFVCGSVGEVNESNLNKDVYDLNKDDVVECVSVDEDEFDFTPHQHLLCL